MKADVQAICQEVFRGDATGELQTLFAANTLSMMDGLKGKARPRDYNEVMRWVAETLTKILQTHGDTLQNMYTESQTLGAAPGQRGKTDANKYRPTVDDVNAAIEMVARDRERRTSGTGMDAVNVVKTIH